MTPDIIGTIYTITDADGFEYPEMRSIPGFHVNFPEEAPELAEYLVDPQPVTPYRIYAGGIEPVCYVFQDEAAFRQFFPVTEEV